jgi:hypothetical protein
LLPGAITDQTAGTASGTDLVLVSKSGVLNKVTAASLAGLVDTAPFLRTDGSAAMATGQQLTLGTTNQIAALNAASKGYVDSVAATRLPLTGGTLAGNLLLDGNLTLTTAGVITLSKDPVNALEATTKQYVDNRPGLARAWVNFDGTTSTTWAGGTSTVSRTSGSTTATITTATSHNLITGNSVYALTGVVAGIYIVTVLTATTFTIETVATTTLSAVTITFSGSTIRSSYNVSSITKNGTGDYTLNFATLMADANYVVCGSQQGVSGSSGTTMFTPHMASPTILFAPTTSNFRFLTYAYPLGFFDPTIVNVQIFGN